MKLVIALFLALSAQAVIAAPAPLFSQTFMSLDGKPVRLSLKHGKVMVVNFWGSWCGPCRDELPAFARLQSRYHEQVRFAGVALDDVASVRAFLKQVPINYGTVIADENGMAAMQREGNLAGAVPFTVLYNAQGQRLETHLGALDEDELDQLIQKALHP
ncbi:TlpA family protein disulfide reductase [Chitinibacteraceae bacterium HSL-7]